jgi:hypothetical protein
VYLCARFGREAVREGVFADDLGGGAEKKYKKKFGFGDN